MKYPPLGWAPILLLLCTPAGLWAQTPDNSAAVVQAQATSVVVPKPVRKPDQVITNDTIGLLAVRRAPRIVTAPVAEPATAPDDAALANAAAKRAAEMASLEKQVQEKQKRIALLMKLFVGDEKEFLKNGGAAEADPAVQERRKYEQDELRWETAELAKLEARLEGLRSENRK